MCECIFSPEIKTYCQMSAHLPQDRAPCWDPHVPISSSPRLPGLAVLPPPSWAAQFYPLPPPRAPPQQQSSSRVTFNQSFLPEPSSPRASSPHSDPGPQNWGSAQWSFTGKKRLSLPQYASAHSRVCVCMCVCVRMCVQARVHRQCLAWSHTQHCGTDVILL